MQRSCQRPIILVAILLMALGPVAWGAEAGAEPAAGLADSNLVELSELGAAEKLAFEAVRKASSQQVYEMQRARGVIETGLTTLFDPAVKCRAVDSEAWAISYSQKRGKPALHKGIDIPAPEGTPVLAVADGVVVGKFLNDHSPKGVEIVIRHEPAQTGLPVWTYSQYTHLLELPELPIGSRVKMGSEIGRTSNTGLSGLEAKRRNSGEQSSGRKTNKARRPALHFAIFYSASPHYAVARKGIIPADGYYMDPHAFYRTKGPFDSVAMNNLPAGEKQLPIPYLTEAGQVVPTDTKVIWPYSCEPR